MGITMPAWAAELLNEVGYTWPKTDEAKVLQLAQGWSDFATTLARAHSDAGLAASSVVDSNAGVDMLAFQARWASPAGGHAVLDEGQFGVHAVGGALIVCGAVVLALKVNVLTQLAILAAQVLEAIALAPATAGASLLQLPFEKHATNLAINLLTAEAMRVISG
jgi:hypothetical protein